MIIPYPGSPDSTLPKKLIKDNSVQRMIRIKKIIEKNKFENPVWCDLLKLNCILHGDLAEGFFSLGYMQEKIQRILEGNMIWNSLVEECFDQYVEDVFHRIAQEMKAPRDE